MDRLKKRTTVNGKKFTNHIDGYNLLPYLTGQQKESPRSFFFYFSDDGDVLGIR
jgi:arylsulfatase